MRDKFWISLACVIFCYQRKEGIILKEVPILEGGYVNGTSFLMAQQPLVGQDLLTVEASRSHSDTPQSVGLLWTNDQLVAETSTWEHQHSQETDLHNPGGR